MIFCSIFSTEFSFIPFITVPVLCRCAKMLENVDTVPCVLHDDSAVGALKRLLPHLQSVIDVSSITDDDDEAKKNKVNESYRNAVLYFIEQKDDLKHLVKSREFEKLFLTLLTFLTLDVI